MSLSKFINSTSSRKFLLYDGCGALVTFFLLRFVLVWFQDYIGMPKEVLYALSVAPLIFAIYSFSAHFFAKKNWSFYLRGIAFANLIYSLASISLVIANFSVLTKLGVLHFSVELIIILLLVMIEFRISKRG